MRRLPPARSPGAVLFFVLLAATLVISLLVVRARTPDLALEVVELRPTELVLDGEELEDRTTITFFVRKADPSAEVTIVDPDRRVVRRLAEGVALEEGERRTFTWDGRRDDGRSVRSGRYRVRVLLPERGRDIVWPRRITVTRAGDRRMGGTG